MIIPKYPSPRPCCSIRSAALGFLWGSGKITSLEEPHATIPLGHPLGPATPSAVWTSSTPIAWVQLDQNLHLHQISRWFLWLVQFWKHHLKRSEPYWPLTARRSPGWGLSRTPAAGQLLTGPEKLFFISITEHRCVIKTAEGGVQVMSACCPAPSTSSSLSGKTRACTCFNKGKAGEISWREHKF